jgi:hypothetical protein
VCAKHQKSSAKSKKCNELESSTYITFKDDLFEISSIIKKEFRDSIEHNRKFTFNFSVKRPIEKILSKTASWNGKHAAPCFVSTGSFDLNKNSSYCSDREMPHNNHFFTNSSFKSGGGHQFEINVQQKRHFKTFRAVIAEHQRNPTLLSRLKEAYNQPAGSTGKRLDSLNPTAAAAGGGQATKQTIQHESLSKLLNQFDSNLTPEQKQQLKVAFAEGYLAANHPENAEKGGRAIKYLKVSDTLKNGHDP